MKIRIERDGFVMTIEENEYAFNVTVHDSDNGLVDSYSLATVDLVAKLVNVAIRSQTITASDIELASPAR